MLSIIYTEDMNRELIEVILDEKFEGYTIIEQTGVWKKAKEKSLQIQIVDADQKDLEYVIKSINILNLQDCCMLLNIPCEVKFL